MPQIVSADTDTAFREASDMAVELTRVREAWTAQRPVIRTEEHYRALDAFIKDVKARRKMIDERRQSFVRPLNDVVHDLNGFFKPPLAQCDLIEEIGKAAMMEYHKWASDERQKALLAAEAAARAQQDASTHLVRAEAAAPPVIDGTAFVTTYKFEIVDAAALPREFLIPDEKHIGRVVREAKGAINIPGVRVWTEQNPAMRTASK